MPDETVEILIKTTAQGDGAKQAEAGIKGVNEAAKAAGETQHDAAKGAEKLNEGLKQQAKHSEFLGLNHRGLHKVVHALGEQFPIAGMAARAMLNPILFAFTAAIGIFAKTKERLDEFNKALDEAGEKAAEPTFLEGINARKEALEKAHEAARKFADDISAIASGEERYAAALKLSLELLREKAAADKNLADAELATDLARIAHDRQAGTLGKEDAAIEEAKAQRRAQSRKAGIEDEQDTAPIKEKQKALNEAVTRSDGLANAVDAARKPADDLAGRLAANQKHLEKLTGGKPGEVKEGQASPETEKQFKTASDAVDKLGGHDSLKKTVDYYRSSGDPFFQDTAESRALDDYELAARKRTAEAQGIAKTRAAISSDTGTKSDADERLKRAEDEAKANKATIDRLQQEIHDERELSQARKSGRDNVRKEDAAKRITEEATAIDASGPIGHTAVIGLEQAEEIARRILAKDPTVTGSERSETREFAKLGSGRDLNDTQSAQYLRVQASDPQKNSKLLETIVQKMEAANSADSASFQSMLAALQAQERTNAYYANQIRDITRRLDTTPRPSMPPPTP